MDPNYAQSLNLAAILENLSSHAQQVPQNSHTSQLLPPSNGSLEQHVQTNPYWHQHERAFAQNQQYYQDNSVAAAHANPIISSSSSTPGTFTPPNQNQEARQKATRPLETEAAASQPDPRDLIEWSKGLRFVNGLASQNKSFSLQIQKVVIRISRRERY